MSVYLCALGSAGTAHADGARVQWLSNPDARVTGYYVYVRASGEPYGSPIDASSPIPRADGTVTLDVGGLSESENYFFAVSVYAADQSESVISSEVALHPEAANACIIDRCVTQDDCTLDLMPDGTPCVSEDPCAADAICVQGVCEAGSGNTFAVSKLTLKEGKSDVRMTAKGSFDGAVAIDPLASGATLEILDASGAVLYRALIPGSAFKSNRAATTFRYAASAKEAEATNGLRRLVLRNRNGTWAATMRARTAVLTEALQRDQLTVVLRFGDTCVRHFDLGCVNEVLRAQCSSRA